MEVSNGVARVARRLGNSASLRWVLRSRLVWRLSGFAYSTSVMATTGSYVDVDSYIASMRARMDRVRDYFPSHAKVLDFGTGIGGNLFGCAHFVDSGVGVDVNPLYLRIARKLAERKGYPQFSFVTYDGVTLPPVRHFDVFLSFGTFERLGKDEVRDYMRQVLRPSSGKIRFIVYFLTERARDIGFGQALGQDAYTFWSEKDLTSLEEDLQLSPVARITEFPNAGDSLILDSRVN